MPKKTKKEKIIAQYRRRLKLIESLSLPVKEKEISHSQLSLTSSKEKKPEIITPQPKLIQEEFDLKKYFLIDLRKSLLLSFLIIGFEFFLFFIKVIK